MQFVVPETTPAASRWTSRVALFALVLLVTAFLLHRLFGLDTHVALNLVKAAYLCVGISLILAVAAMVVIWRHGTAGTARVVFAVALSLLMGAGPAALALVARDYPMINDVTTDTVTPPPFEVLAKQRKPGANPAAYPGEAVAAEQRQAFPDIKPLMLDRSTDEIFDIVVEVVRRARMEIVRASSPEDEPGASGFIEAVDRTLVFGFYDDVAIRVTGGETTARVDIRSASRFGRTDLGTNAERIRTLMRDIVTRYEATMPTAEDERAARDKKAAEKLKKAKDPKPGTPRKKRRRDR